MTYGYKWDERDQRFVVGSQTDKLFLRQNSELQPVGHWVRRGEREFRACGMYVWEPSPLERLMRRLRGWRWHRYPSRVGVTINLDMFGPAGPETTARIEAVREAVHRIITSRRGTA